MRIISGELKGRRLQAPANLPVRPTTDFAKESLFNILRHKVDLEQCAILDLFAGIGGISFEFASRGAQSLISVEQNPKCVDFIRQNSEKFHLEQHRVLQVDAFAYIPKTKDRFDLIYADPPYDLAQLSLIPTLIFKHELLRPEGLFIIEHSQKDDFSDYPFFSELRQYGKVHFSFFKNA